MWARWGWVVFLGVLAAYSLVQSPTTPRAFFEVRCSSCHELRVEKLCAFSPAERGAIVHTMRRVQGADAVISPREARIIAQYLEEQFSCPYNTRS